MSWLETSIVIYHTIMISPEQTTRRPAHVKLNSKEPGPKLCTNEALRPVHTGGESCACGDGDSGAAML